MIFNITNEFGFASTASGGWIVPSDYTFSTGVEIPKDTIFEGSCHFVWDVYFLGCVTFPGRVIFDRKATFEHRATFHGDVVFYHDIVFNEGCDIKGRGIFG